MLRKVYKELFVIVGIFAIGWAIFIFLKLKPKAPEVAVSVVNEQKIGDLLAENFLSNAVEVPSDTVNEAIFLIRKRLLEAVGNTEYNYVFHVIKDEKVNAFATLGGHIFIFTGLLEFAETPEEIAAVLAHEIAHVEQRHVVNRLVKELGITLVFSVLSGGDPVLISEIVKHSVSTVFDRSQESEADKFSLPLLEKAGISPSYLAGIFRRIEARYGSYNEYLEFLMTHPNTNKRIKDALEYKVESGFQSVPLPINWEAVKRNL